MTCSTSNPGRSYGGTRHYRVAHTDTNLLCREIDKQVEQVIVQIQVNPELMPAIRAAYETEVAGKLGHNDLNQSEKIKAALKAIDEEEARIARLYASGKITDSIWDSLWVEWQDKRRSLEQSLQAAQLHAEQHIQHLDDALNMISRIGVLLRRLDVDDQKALLREVVERVVVNPSGKVVRVELHPPFSYLRHLIDRAQNDAKMDDGGKTKASDESTGLRSIRVPLSSLLSQN